MSRIVVRLISALLISCLTCAVGWAQATAQISGIVRDQTGAVLPGVEITASQTETGITRTALTNEIGSYVLSSLATGPYRLEAGLQGFRTFVQTGIVLQVNSVETGGLSPQSRGMHADAAVTSVTKSGTNELHGSLFEFLRDDRFKARNYFATEKDKLTRHQLGGTLGGPIVRNKLFFFGG